MKCFSFVFLFVCLAFFSRVLFSNFFWNVLFNPPLNIPTILLYCLICNNVDMSLISIPLFHCLYFQHHIFYMCMHFGHREILIMLCIVHVGFGQNCKYSWCGSVSSFQNNYFNYTKNKTAAYISLTYKVIEPIA